MHSDSPSAAHDGVYDVLISYRHEDLLFAEELVRRLWDEYEIRAFLDTQEHRNGHEWREFWLRALEKQPAPHLDPRLGPSVVVLATPAMELERPNEDVVVQEIGHALRLATELKRTIPINVLRFSPDGYDALRKRTRDQLNWNPQVLHYAQGLERIDVTHPSALTEADWSEICAAVADVLTVLHLRRLEKLRQEAVSWAHDTLHRQLCKTTFSDATPAIRDARKSISQLDNPAATQLLALVGAGGTGKSFALAMLLLEFCGDVSTRRFPITLRVDELEHATHVVRRKLRLRLGVGANTLHELVELRNYGRLVFVTDGLEHAASVNRASEALNALREVGDVWITSRSSIWDEANREFQLEEDFVFKLSELDAMFVGQCLGLPLEQVTARPYLQQALYLDLASHMSQVASAGTESHPRWPSATHLLDAFRDWAVLADQASPADANLQSAAEHLVKRLAERQLERRAFSIPSDLLLSPAEAKDARVTAALKHLLESRPFLVKDTRVVDGNTHAFFRLRHDVIDAHNIVRISEARDRTAIIDGQDMAFGQIVSDVLAQTAVDEKDDVILEQLFDAFVLACDNKAPAELSSPWNARAWAGTFLVQRRYSAFLPYILDMLGGEQLGRVPPKRDGDRISTRTPPPPRVTREALSSIASGLLGARTLGIPDPGGKMLATLLQATSKAERKARLVEAIAKFDDGKSGALSALMDLSKDEALLEVDPELMAYIARGLREIVKVSTREEDREIAIGSARHMLEVGIPLVESGGKLGRPALRSLLDCVRSMDSKAIRDPDSILPWTDEEIAQGLSLHAYQKPADLSDWRVFWYYAELLREKAGLVPGTTMRNNVLALGVGLWHDAIPCRVRALDALATCDHPMARAFLLHTIATQWNDSVQDAALNALGRQLRTVTPPVAAAVGMALRQVVAKRVDEGHDSRGSALRELLDLAGLTAGQLFSAGAIELQRLTGSVRLESGVASPLDPAVKRLTELMEPTDPGPDLEQKIKLLPRLKSTSSISYAESSWREARPFHEAATEATKQRIEHTPRSDFREKNPSEAHAIDLALRRYVETAGALHECFEKLLDGTSGVPGLGVVHALIVTSDGMVVEARRSEDAHYHPGAWAPSFEEQIQAVDLPAADPIAAALLRGMNEEFGRTFAASDVRVELQSAFVEWPILNVGIAVVATVLVPWAALQDGRGDGELIAHRGVPLDERRRSLFRDELGGLHLTGDKWHPSAALRVGLLDAAMNQVLPVGTANAS